jgi:hypothetical protein
MVLPFLKLVSACGLLTLAATTAFAQSSPCPQATKSYGIPGAAASLAGCPFSAVIETESTQSLADGTQIRKKFKGLVYRDSAGRIRYETFAPTNPDTDFPAAPNMVHIFDPVAGFSYVLFPETAVGLRHRLNESAKSLAVPQRSSAPDSASTPNPGFGPPPNPGAGSRHRKPRVKVVGGSVGKRKENYKDNPSRRGR